MHRRHCVRYRKKSASPRRYADFERRQIIYEIQMNGGLVNMLSGNTTREDL